MWVKAFKHYTYQATRDISQNLTMAVFDIPPPICIECSDYQCRRSHGLGEALYQRLKRQYYNLKTAISRMR